MIFDTTSGNDSRRYNAPVANEVAFVFKNDSGEPPSDRDLRAYKFNLTIPVHGSIDSKYNIKKVDALMNVFEPMTYPLCPYGELGWHENMIQEGIEKFILYVYCYKLN